MKLSDNCSINSNLFCCRGPEHSIFVGDLTPDVTDVVLQVLAS